MRGVVYVIYCGRHQSDGRCETTQVEAVERRIMVASTKTSGGALRTKPHILGGSNNLVAERNRREKVEEALQTTDRKSVV